jgi:hypothetical protein
LELNDQGVLTDLGRPWTRGTIRQVLTNEKYIGNNIYNRTSCKLKRKHVRNSADMWIRAEGAFESVVAPEQFFVARGIFQERLRRLTNEEMLARLRALAGEHLVLSSHLIDQTDGMPSSGAYRTRFGGLLAAYRLAGCEPLGDFSYLETNRQLRERTPTLVAELIEKLSSAGAVVT